MAPYLSHKYPGMRAGMRVPLPRLYGKMGGGCPQCGTEESLIYGGYYSKGLRVKCPNNCPNHEKPYFRNFAMNQLRYEVSELNNGSIFPVPYAPEKFGPELNHLGELYTPSNAPSASTQPRKLPDFICYRHNRNDLPKKKQHRPAGNKDCKNQSCASCCSEYGLILCNLKGHRKSGLSTAEITAATIHPPTSNGYIATPTQNAVDIPVPNTSESRLPSSQTPRTVAPSPTQAAVVIPLPNASQSRLPSGQSLRADAPNANGSQTLLTQRSGPSTPHRGNVSLGATGLGMQFAPARVLKGMNLQASQGTRKGETLVHVGLAKAKAKTVDGRLTRTQSSVTPVQPVQPTGQLIELHCWLSARQPAVRVLHAPNWPRVALSAATGLLEDASQLAPASWNGELMIYYPEARAWLSHALDETVHHQTTPRRVLARFRWVNEEDCEGFESLRSLDGFSTRVESNTGDVDPTGIGKIMTSPSSQIFSLADMEGAFNYSDSEVEQLTLSDKITGATPLRDRRAGFGELNAGDSDVEVANDSSPKMARPSTPRMDEAIDLCSPPRPNGTVRARRRSNTMERRDSTDEQLPDLDDLFAEASLRNTTARKAPEVGRAGLGRSLKISAHKVHRWDSDEGEEAASFPTRFRDEEMERRPVASTSSARFRYETESEDERLPRQQRDPRKAAWPGKSITAMDLLAWYAAATEDGADLLETWKDRFGSRYQCSDKTKYRYKLFVDLVSARVMSLWARNQKSPPNLRLARKTFKKEWGKASGHSKEGEDSDIDLDVRGSKRGRAARFGSTGHDSRFDAPSDQDEHFRDRGQQKRHRDEGRMMEHSRGGKGKGRYRD